MTKHRLTYLRLQCCVLTAAHVLRHPYIRYVCELLSSAYDNISPVISLSFPGRLVDNPATPSCLSYSLYFSAGIPIVLSRDFSNTGPGHLPSLEVLAKSRGQTSTRCSSIVSETKVPSQSSKPWPNQIPTSLEILR